MGRSSKDVRQSRSIQLFIFEFTCLGLESDIFKDNPRSLGARVLTIKRPCPSTMVKSCLGDFKLR